MLMLFNHTALDGFTVIHFEVAFQLMTTSDDWRS